MGAGFSANTLKVKLKMAGQRMQMHTNKKNNSIRSEQKNIAVMLRDNKEESARLRAEFVLHEKNLVLVYDVLSLMCELIATRIGLIAEAK